MPKAKKKKMGSVKKAAKKRKPVTPGARLGRPKGALNKKKKVAAKKTAGKKLKAAADPTGGFAAATAKEVQIATIGALSILTHAVQEQTAVVSKFNSLLGGALPQLGETPAPMPPPNALTDKRAVGGILRGPPENYLAGRAVTQEDVNRAVENARQTVNQFQEQQGVNVAATRVGRPIAQLARQAAEAGQEAGAGFQA